jgi:hypothetical protein
MFFLLVLMHEMDTMWRRRRYTWPMRAALTLFLQGMSRWEIVNAIMAKLNAATAKAAGNCGVAAQAEAAAARQAAWRCA